MYCGGEPELYCFNTTRYTVTVTHRILPYTEGIKRFINSQKWIKHNLFIKT